MSTRNLVRSLGEIVGHDNVSDSPETLIAYSYDGTALPPQAPLCVVRPSSAGEISRIVLFANETGTPIVPRGSGTGLSGGSVPMEGSIVLLTGHRNRIIEIDEDNQTAMVEPGVITAALQRAVDAIGYMYPPDPGSASISTLGGNVAENAGGLRGLKYGVTKNYVMGLEVVLPTGEILWTGGKSAKDVAGYNLRDVLVGSEGTLGIITKILLRIVPKPETSRTLLATFPTMESAAEAVSAVISSRLVPAMLEFLDNTTIRCVEAYAHLGLPTDAGAMLLAETDGHAEVVERESALIGEVFRKCGATQLSRAATAAESDRLKIARRSAFTSLARVRPTTLMEDVAVPRSELANLVRAIMEISRKNDIVIGTFGHAGDGNLHPNYLTDEGDPAEFRRARSTVVEVEEAAIALGGTITGEHGTGLYKKPLLGKMVGSASMVMMRRLKEVMDPNLILNPGKVLDCTPRCEGPLPRSREQIRKFEDVAWV
jgi:glycolate oxidase